MKRVGIGIVMAAGIMAAAHVHAETNPGVQGLNDLLIQKGIITKEEVEAQAKKHSLNIGGYIQIQGKMTQNDGGAGNDDGFNVRRAKINATGYAYEHVKFKLEADFGRSTGNLDDAYIEDDHWAYLVGRVGQFKVPMSFEMLTPDTELMTIERSEVANMIAPERDRGISLGGKVGVLDYTFGLFNGHLPATRTGYTTKSFSNAGRNATNDNDQLLLSGRLAVKPIEWLHLGVSGLSSKDGEGLNAIEHKSFGMELQVKNPAKGCTLQGEYMRQWITDTNSNTTTSDGFYIQAGHYLVKKRLEAVLKYEEYDSNKDLANIEDIRWATVGLNYYIYGNDAKLMVNYVFKDERQSSINNDTLLTQLQLRF